MIFRIEPRRGGKKVAQGVTLGKVKEESKPCQGVINYLALAGLGPYPTSNPGLHPGLLYAAPLELGSEFLFLKNYSVLSS